MSENVKERVCPPSVVKWLNFPLRRLIQNPRKIMGEYVKPGNTVIDLGCGGGFFTVALARMVGEKGRVIAVDLQEEMLNITRNYAAKHGVLNRISLHQCMEDDIRLPNERADFILAFYMVHEVPDRKRFLSQVVSLMKPLARFLMIEPKHHVSKGQFNQMLIDGISVGFKQVKQPKLLFSKSLLLCLNTVHNRHE